VTQSEKLLHAHHNSSCARKHSKSGEKVGREFKSSEYPQTDNELQQKHNLVTPVPREAVGAPFLGSVQGQPAQDSAHLLDNF